MPGSSERICQDFVSKRFRRLEVGYILPTKITNDWSYRKGASPLIIVEDLINYSSLTLLSIFAYFDESSKLLSPKPFVIL